MKRYCGMCDMWVNGRECPRCGADTDAPERTARRRDEHPHTCHDMNPPFPGPCRACVLEAPVYPTAIHAAEPTTCRRCGEPSNGRTYCSNACWMADAELGR